jgi:hypothetical protein
VVTPILAADRLVVLPEEMTAIAVRIQHVAEKELVQINVDTTFSKRTSLTQPIRNGPPRLSTSRPLQKNCGVQLRQTYRRVGFTHA